MKTGRVLSANRCAAAVFGGVVLLTTAAGHADAGVSTVASTVPIYRTDCTYLLSVPVVDAERVTFVESDPDGKREQILTPAVSPTVGVASLRWHPRVRGDRVLVARQGDAHSVPLPVSVRVGGGTPCS